MGALHQKLRRRFTNFQKNGEGSFGKVFIVEDIDSERQMAIKTYNKENDDGIPVEVLREIVYLRAVEGSPHVLRLHEVIRDGRCFAIVLDAMACHMKEHCHQHKPSRLERLALATQVVKGVYHIHKLNVMHRDLKPQNILVDQARTVKLGDFGTARTWIQGRTYTSTAGTLWYRAIEILLGKYDYDTSIDVWSLGCVLFELLEGRVLFCGDSEVEMIFQIYSKLGSPNRTSWTEVEDLEHYNPEFFRKKVALPLADTSLSEDDIEMIHSCLVMNPAHRTTAEKLLQHMSANECLSPRELGDDAFWHKTNVDRNHRSNTFNRIVDLHANLKLDHHVLHLAIKIVDAYLGTCQVEKKAVQLVDLTGLFIASKLEEIYRVEVREFAKYATDAYTESDILEMEFTMLDALQYNFATIDHDFTVSNQMVQSVEDIPRAKVAKLCAS